MHETSWVRGVRVTAVKSPPESTLIRSPGVTNLVLSEHIRRYHSYLFSCPECGIGFPNATQKNLPEMKDKHCRLVHSGPNGRESADVNKSSSSSNHRKRKRRKKSRGSESPRGDMESRLGSDSGHPTSGQSGQQQRVKRKQADAYPGRMTPEQDEAFESWLKRSDKSSSKADSVQAKYVSLCHCIFGENTPPPANPCEFHPSGKWFFILVANRKNGLRLFGTPVSC